MAWQKKILINGMNGDDSLRFIGEGQALNIMNARCGISEFGKNLRLEMLPGTIKVQQNVLPPYGINKCLGSAVDPATHRVVYALWNSFGYHGIYCLDLSDLTNIITYAVLYDTQIDGGLNFSKSFRIDRNCHITNGLFYWCEGTNNQPRKINIDSGIKGNLSSYSTSAVAYSFPLRQSEITIIKPPPPLAPNISKSTDVSVVTNFIENNSYEFVFLYDMYDGERTVVGTYSPSSRLNKQTDTYNFISVTMDVFEFVPQIVKIVHLAVRTQDGTQGGGNTVNIIKSWSKDVTDERNDIIEQNNGTSQLSFDFYGDITGEAIPPENILKPFDSVPIYGKTIAPAKNRNFIANETAGYDTPSSTSLAFSQTTVNIGGTVLNKNVILVEVFGGNAPFWGYSARYIYLNANEITNSPAGYYAITITETNVTGTFVPPLPPAAPPSVSVAGLTFRGATQSAVKASVKPPGLNDATGSIFNTSSTTTIQVTGTTIRTYDIFKTLSQYKIGVVFYDFAMRKCGVVTNDGLVFEISGRNFAFTSGVNGIVWTLDNTNALTEIPDWAYYYSIVRTLNLKTRFFVDGFTNAAKYATKDVNGVWQYASAIFLNGTLGIALDQTALIQAGLGYTFTEGDICVITLDDNTQYQFPVLAQDGINVIVKSQDIGDLTNRQIEYEIYTPYITSEQEPYYEIGQMYRITNPGTTSRQYETVSDILVPDAYALTRNWSTATYFAEAMCPNDLFYRRWDNDGGKPNFITNQGQVEKPNFGSFSNVYIPGTQVNGLSTFEPLNEFNVSEDSGEINKLILTQKIQDQGTVMLAVCRNEINSIYIGEQQISDSTGATQFFAKAGGVIGTINNLKQSYGCINPETIFEYLGLIFGYDILNGVVWQYSNEGLESVSRYKEERFFQRYAKEYMKSSPGNLDNINGFHHIPACIDPLHKEALFILPGLIYENYANVLPSYTSVPDYATSIINRFDIYDGLAKTMAFKYRENNWGSNYNYGSEWLDYLQNTLIGFKNGEVWIHNADTDNYNRFYGMDYPARICVSWNNIPSAIKDVFSIAIEGSRKPDFLVLYSDNPWIQITDLASTDDQWGDEEGVSYADFLMDRLSPNSTGTAEEKLYSGDIIKSPYPMIMLEFQPSDLFFFLEAINLQWDESKGQIQLITKV